MDDSLHQKGCDNQCTEETRLQDKRGSASRNGEARRKCAGKPRAKRRGAQGGLRVGVGGWTLTKPNQVPNPPHRGRRRGGWYSPNRPTPITSIHAGRLKIRE